MDGLRNLVLRGPTPVTNSIIFLNIAILALSYAARPLEPFVDLNFTVDLTTFLTHPWALVLYTLYPPGPIGLLFWGFTFWQFAGSLERSWGTGRFVLFFIAISVISALSVMLGDYVLHLGIPLVTFLLPLAGIIIATCMLNPGQPINCWFINIPTKWAMAIVFALVWLLIGNPLLGLFAEAGPLAAMWYIAYGRSWRDIGHYTTRPRGDIIDFQAARKRKSNAVYLDGSIKRSPFDIAGRMRDMQERKRLERLLRNSGLSDPDERRDDRR